MRTIDALIGLGSSTGDRHASLALAVKMLDADPLTEVTATSTTWLNPPMGAASGWFLNGAVRVETSRSARGLLDLCQRIEKKALRRLPVNDVIFSTQFHLGSVYWYVVNCRTRECPSS